MNFFKLLLVLAVLALAAFGLMAAFGFIIAAAKVLIFLGVIALAGFGAYKLLSKPDRAETPQLDPAEAELLRTQQILEEMRQKQLTK